MLIKKRWLSLCQSSRFIEVIDASLRGSSQVIFISNPLTGLLNFIAFLWGAYDGGTSLAVAIGAILGTLIATATSYLLRLDVATRRSGLYGFNGLLVGAAIPTFFANSIVSWTILILACAVSVIATTALSSMLKKWGVPGLTFPFVFVSWVVMLAAYGFSGLTISGLPQPMLAQQIGSPLSNSFELALLLSACFTSIGQVFFVNSPIAGAIFTLALAVDSRLCATFALIGSVSALITATAVGASQALIQNGLYGYSSVLTAVAVGCIFIKASSKNFFYALLASVATVFIQSASNTVCQTVGVPALTFPFVLTTWLFLLAYQQFNTLCVNDPETDSLSQLV